MRLPLGCLVLVMLAPTRAPFSVSARADEHVELAAVMRSAEMHPVLDDGPRIVRRDVFAGAGGSDRRWVRAVRDLLENRVDIDALPWGAPLTLWTVDDEIVAFEIPAMTQGEEATTAFAARIDVDGAQRWVFEDGSTVDGPMLTRPVRYQAISSKIGLREHPIRKRVKFHAGTDYAAPIGTPIRAIADARVTKASRSWSAGKFLVLQHDDGYETKYLHLDAIAAGVVDGARIRQGEVIGSVGKTGRVTGPHLHFEIRDRWRTPIDPLVLEFPAGDVVEDAATLRMLSLRRALLDIVNADGSRDVLAPLVVARDGVEERAPTEPERAAFMPPLSSTRGPGARARLTPPPSRRRRRLGDRPLFDDGAVADELCERSRRLAAEFPEMPRFT